MRRFWSGTALLTALLMGAWLATLGSPLGMAPWHYHVGFLAVALLTGVGWPLLAHRRFATLTMVFSGIPAVITGAMMLYTRDFPWKEWVTWWHSIMSAVLVAAFLVHTLHNATRLGGLLARLFTTDRGVGIPSALVGGFALGAGALTWTGEGRALFHRESYLALASWAIFLTVLFVYAGWLLFRLPRLRRTLERAPGRERARTLIDAGLWITHVLVIVSGFALVYFEAALRADGTRYLSKWWHTAASAAFLGLVALHVGFNARLLRAHARRVERDLTRS